MSDPIKKPNETSAEANKALREAAQQRRAQQQEQAAQQRRAAQQQSAAAKAQAEAAAEEARKNAQMRADAARHRQQSAQPSAPAQAAEPVARPYAASYDRDDAPIRQRRDGQTGCLGGVIYFAFVLSVSIILACVGWLAASSVLWIWITLPRA